VWYCYTPDRKGEHPRTHLSNFTGTLQADAYAGYEKVYEGGRILEAACWAHYPESRIIQSELRCMQTSQTEMAIY
jgi:transposase